MTFAFNEINADWARAIIEDYDDGRDPSAVVALLTRVQQQQGWISREAIDHIAQVLSLSPGAIFDLLVTYSDFKLMLPVPPPSSASRALLEVRSHLSDLAEMGLRERADAKADGVSSFYVSSGSFGDHLVEEKPDGTTLTKPMAPAAEEKAPTA